MTEQDALTLDTVREAVLDFIAAELVPADVAVGPDDDLLSGELLDSLAIIRLATHVDQAYALGMKPSDFRVENFRTATALAAYVLRSSGSPESGPTPD